MITFSCSNCKAQYNVDDSQAGQMGRCTNCNSVMRVPAKSTNLFQIFKGNDYFSDKKLNSLYADLLKVYEPKIVKQRIEKGELFEHAVMEVRTEQRRSQIVLVYKIDIVNHVFVGIASKIGRISTADAAITAMRSVDIFSMFTVSLNDENDLWVSNMRLIEGFTAREFAGAIDAVAKHADELEKEIFGSDRH